MAVGREILEAFSLLIDPGGSGASGPGTEHMLHQSTYPVNVEEREKTTKIVDE